MGSQIYQVDLISHLVQRNFRLRYTGTLLGLLWSIALPLIQLFVFVFLFARVVPLGIEAYPAFVFSALLPWTWLSNTLVSAGGLFIGNRDLVRRPNFKPSTLVLVNTLSQLLSYLVSLPILIVVLAFYGRGLTVAVLLFPVLLLIQSVLLLGLGLIIATVNVFYRDVQHLVAVALPILFYVVPVFYRPQQFDSTLARLLMWNPIAILIESYREILFYQRVPRWDQIVVPGVISLLVCMLGYLIYQRRLPYVVDAL
jgi:ABC-type polysaccharide/polyol phosphate export permease